MFVILSQKIDSKSEYEEKLCQVYHYPSRYRNQLHEGDVFIYYQGSKKNKSHRYYFGVGTIGSIESTDGLNYYAKLLNSKIFTKKVPIYLPDGGYYEQLGYESLRIQPPWQNSIRPLSQLAFDLIMAASETSLEIVKRRSLVQLEESLKGAIRGYFLDNDHSALLDISKISSEIISYKSDAIVNATCPEENFQGNLTISVTPNSEVSDLYDYCRTLKMSYSYKPLVIIALMKIGDSNGNLHIKNLITFFRQFYSGRRKSGQSVQSFV